MLRTRKSDGSRVILRTELIFKFGSSLSKKLNAPPTLLANWLALEFTDPVSMIRMEFAIFMKSLDQFALKLEFPLILRLSKKNGIIEEVVFKMILPLSLKELIQERLTNLIIFQLK